MDKIQQSGYRAFVKEIKEKINQAQYQAMKAVNQELINLNWEIGRSIVEKQDQFGWGKAVVESLSKDLQKEFPGMPGFSSQNQWRMRKFYLTYSSNEKLAPMVREISWSHNIIVMEKCKDDLEREFYLRMTKKYGWTKNILIHQIETRAYESYLVNQTNFDKILGKKYRHQAKLAVRDHYSFDFLELRREYNERELKLGIIKNIRSFLLEMGGDFTFIGNQYKLDIDGEEFFIDLLLYHRKLKSLVAIKLKVTEFNPEYTGQMQFSR